MRAPQSVKRARLAMERLEDRVVPTTATYLANGTLAIMGTDGSDVIRASQSGGQVAVSGVAQTFTNVKTVVIDGGAGNDQITVDPSITATTWLWAGDGNDFIQGGSGTNHIYGGRGNDTLVAGTGSDQVYGGTGTSTLSGPTGATLVHRLPNITAALSTVGQQVLDLVNQQRAANGLAPLTYNAQLTAAAVAQVNNMTSLEPVLGDYNAAMQHTLIGAPEPTMQDRAKYVGYDFYTYGENIAYGFHDAASVMTAWMNSAGHRANILNPLFTQIGVALAYTPDGVPYWSEEFAAPSGSNGSGSGSTTITQPPTGYGAGPSLAGKIYAVGSDAGSSSTLTVYDAASGAVKFYMQPYGSSFTGGVRVATGDVNGDGKDDFVVAPGPGSSPVIRIYNGLTGQEIREFMAYDSTFTGGVNVALGDVNGDGHLDIITGADAGGGPHVKVFDGVTGNVLQSFFAYSPTFHGGVHVAAGDVNGDGHADIITGAGASGGPHVEVFDGATGKLLRSFFAYGPSFTGGVFVAAGDVNGDGKADIITGAGAGGGPHVKVFDGSNLATLASFFAGSPTFTSGVRVRGMDIANGSADMVTASGGPDHILRFFHSDGSSIASFLAGDPGNINGIFVG